MKSISVKNIFINPIFLSVALFSQLSTNKVYAACTGTSNFSDCTDVSGGSTRFLAANLIGDFVTRILPIILGIAGMIAVVMIIISGFQFVTSSGNPESAANARGRLTFALIGFAVVALAFALTQIVDTVFLHTSGLF